MLPTYRQHVITLLAKSLQIACRASGIDMPQFHVQPAVRLHSGVYGRHQSHRRGGEHFYAVETCLSSW